MADLHIQGGRVADVRLLLHMASGFFQYVFIGGRQGAPAGPSNHYTTLPRPCCPPLAHFQSQAGWVGGKSICRAKEETPTQLSNDASYETKTEA